MRGFAGLVLGMTFVAAAAGYALAGVLDDAAAAMARGEFEKAAEIARKVPETAKDHEKALQLFGEAELGLELWDPAEEAFRKILAKTADSVPALTGLGRALTGKGRIPEGAEVLGRAIKLDNRDAAAWRAQADNIAVRGTPDDLKAAATNLEATLKLDAKDPLTNRALVEVRLELQDLDAAEKVADSYSKCDKDAPMTHFLKAMVLDRRGKADAAVAGYEKAIRALRKDERLLDAHKFLALALVAADPELKNAPKVQRALDQAKRYADLGGRDKEFIAKFDAIRTKVEAAGAGAKAGGK